MSLSPEKDRWSRHAQAQEDNTPGDATATRRAGGHLDKPLPAKPRESGEFWLDDSASEMDTRSFDDGESVNLEYLRQSPAPSADGFPPSPMSSTNIARPRAPTPSASVPASDDETWSSNAPPHGGAGPVNLNSPTYQLQNTSQARHNPRHAPETDSNAYEQVSARPFARPAKALPDPSQFPDPYPNQGQPSRLSSHPPTLYSSSSASPRSSAYTTYSSRPPSNDYGHVRISSEEEDTSGIISSAVAQALESNGIVSATPGSRSSRAPIDKSRWSEHGFSVRSRSSSISNTYGGGPSHDAYSSPPRLAHKPSYDASWATVDERDEVGISDEDDDFLGDFEEEDETELEDDQGDAVLAAEEGRGLIVRGDRRPVSQLHVQPGTTHLLVSSSTTPNSMPSFLTNIVPQISNTLLALDISANFLSALPPVLAHCANLEELNVAYNPLRVLPVFVAHLTNLRVLIADSTGISTLPEALVDLDRLHTISIRKNKLHALPSWLCLLPALGTLIVDGNPFQGPWKALVDPLLTKSPTTPAYPPSTPMMPHSSEASTYTDSEDSDEEDSGPTRHSGLYDKLTAEEEEQTITPDRLPPVGAEQIPPTPPIPTSPRGLTRTRTTPNRAFYGQNRAKSTVDEPVSATPEDSNFAEREVRRMKSAGDIRRGRPFAPPTPEDPSSSRPPLQRVAASSSNLLMSTSPPTTPERPGMSKRFASVGAAATIGAFGRGSDHASRRPLAQSMWDNSPDSTTTEEHLSPGRGSGPSSPGMVTSPVPTESPVDWSDGKSILRGRRGRDGKEGKEKSGRWGFLKKMSMGKMNASKTEVPTSRPPTQRTMPQIDMRFSTMGSLDAVVPSRTPPDSPQLSKKASVDALRVVTSPPPPSTQPSLPSPPPSGNSLLTPTIGLAPKSAKRRSFLPLDTHSLSIATPDAGSFVGSMTATSEEEPADLEDRQATPSPGPPSIDHHELMRMEEDRQREAYSRALRSVMAYLKDMNDLSLSQQPIASQEDSMFMTRPRRATAADGTTSPGSIASSEGQLRSTDSIRMNGMGQTMSIAPSEYSQGSGDERKYKDDKGKRALIVREIVTTERTYVKGLHELMDIYIKPASQHANMLTGVGSNKDPAIVPAPERKIVFGGVEALCSFHKDIFLPALEVAAAPVLVNPSVLEEADSDGQLSMNVARAVGNTFLRHAAFMRMYSTYINNFDHSVQRVKYWMTERTTGTNSPGSGAPPSSSVAQLAGMGMAISAISGADGSSAMSGPGTPALSTSQRKRIRQFLKRCRMNPRHSQLNLEGYLLLPVQRIPRYKLLLEQLMRSAPPAFDLMDDPIDRALQEISSLANNMNEGKRESESRRKLVQWQARIRGRFPSPLVQPHRRLIMDGPLLLTRVVRKTVVSFDAFNSQGDPSTVQVDCLAPELTPRPLIGILCNDLLVLCRDPSEGQDPNSAVDLWAVLRMQTLPQPASIVHGNALRLVDNKAILYFDAPSPSDALNWYRAINLHIPASKS